MDPIPLQDLTRDERLIISEALEQMVRIMQNADGDDSLAAQLLLSVIQLKVLGDLRFTETVRGE